MTEFLAFLAALNWQFVVLCLILTAGLNFLVVSTMVSRATRRAASIKHQEQMEQKRIDAARSIVPVRPRNVEE